MGSNQHGLKDQVAGKFKEVKGKITGDRQEEAAGKTQKVLGKAKDKVQDLKDSLTGNDKEGTQ